MEEMELCCFELITNVGDARSSFIQSISAAKQGNFAEAEKLIEAGEKSFIKGHKVHGDLIQKAAAGDEIPFSLILMHAEDQMMSSESFKILAGEFLDLYKKIL